MCLPGGHLRGEDELPTNSGLLLLTLRGLQMAPVSSELLTQQAAVQGSVNKGRGVKNIPWKYFECACLGLIQH